MKLLSLECYNYRRTLLSGFRYLKLTPENVIQLILGTNGSGKSSLLREILPSVLRSKDFADEGYMERQYEHRGVIYVLRSSFNPQRHSFIKDGMEMNVGGTGRVQNELISQEFGITPFIRDFLVGKKPARFSMMSPLQRRELFTMMSTVNYDYALSRFTRLRERLRDTSGALKLARNRLVIETSKILDETTRVSMRERADELHKNLASLLEVRTPVDTPSMELERRLRDTMRRIEVGAMELHAGLIQAPVGFNLTNEEDLAREIDQRRQQVSLLRDRMSQLSERIDELRGSMPTLNLEEGQTKESVSARISELEAQRDRVLATLTRSWQIRQPRSALQAIESVRGELLDIFTTIDSNEDGKYSKTALNDALALQTSIADQKYALQKQLANLDAQIAHQDRHKQSGDVVCPKCTHTWIQGYDAGLHEQYLTQRGEAQAKVNELDQQYRTTSEWIQTLQAYFDQYRQYLRIKSSTRLIEELWELCDDQGQAYKYPRTIPPLVDGFIKDLGRMVSLEETESEILTLKKQQELIDRVDRAANERNDQQLKTLERNLSEITERLVGEQTSLDQLTRFDTSLRRAKQLADTLKELLGRASGTYDEIIQTLQMETLHGTIREVQSELASLEDDLSHVLVQENLIKDLEQQIQGFELDEQAIKVTMQALSPTEGLIAEGMLGFINSFFAKVNRIVASIFTYPMVFQECKFDEDSVDLDYRFPLRVKQEIVPDIIDASEGQAEVADLATKIVVMHCLQLEDYPLFLDEFGATFDPKHRSTSMLAIRNLISQLAFPQVFIVSHYEHSYGSLIGADISVLCDSNVNIPEGANKCLERKA